ncbi:MAG: hypothetical protein WD492_12770 [Alkalispirochaeta sp.]
MTSYRPTQVKHWLREILADIDNEIDPQDTRDRIESLIAEIDHDQDAARTAAAEDLREVQAEERRRRV